MAIKNAISHNSIKCDDDRHKSFCVPQRHSVHSLRSVSQQSTNMNFLKHYKWFVRIIFLVGIHPFSINSAATEATTSTWNIFYSTVFFTVVTIASIHAAYVRYSTSFTPTILSLTLVTETFMNILIYASTMYLFIQNGRRQSALINSISTVDGKIKKYFNLQPENARFFRLLLARTFGAVVLFLIFKYTLIQIYLPCVSDMWFVYTSIWIHLTLIVVVMYICGIGDMLMCRFDVVTMVLRSMCWIMGSSDQYVAVKYSTVMAHAIDRVTDVLVDLCSCNEALTDSFGIQILLNQTIDLFCITIQGFNYFRHNGHESNHKSTYMFVKMLPLVLKDYYLIRRADYLGCKVMELLFGTQTN